MKRMIFISNTGSGLKSRLILAGFLVFAVIAVVLFAVFAIAASVILIPAGIIFFLLRPKKRERTANESGIIDVTDYSEIKENNKLLK